MKNRLATLAGYFALAITLLILLSAGYRAEYSPKPVELSDDFASKIAAAEAAAAPVPGSEKTIEWRGEPGAKTPFALVQLHGWSATRQEISPVGETIALTLGMNLFMTRFCGHGLGTDGMNGVTAECLLHDAEEAFAVGKRLGDKVVLLATSTGSATALHLASRYPGDVAALILVSPNFRPKDPMSLLLRGPVGRWIARAVLRTHEWKPENDRVAKYWTTSYDAETLTELMNLLSWTNQIRLANLKMPMIMFLTEDDKILSVGAMKAAFAKYGGPKELVVVPNAGHVPAGDILNPAGTPLVVARSKTFLARELGISNEDAGPSSQDE